MTMPQREAHVERMLSRRVRDAEGHVLGRLEEMRVEIVDGEYVVVEFHLGSGALLERIAGFIRQLPFFEALPRVGREYRIPWQLLDLTDPDDLRVRVRRDDLRRRLAEASS
ncbi:MAG TPA: hypothetical protein VHB25_09535 [Gemmatimonadaceae bacterium]|nr:hypothetical protein [Gemmatimonadaceae bacterium]